MKIPTILVLGKNNFKRKDKGIYTYAIPSDFYNKNIDVAIAIWSAKVFRCTTNVSLNIAVYNGEDMISYKQLNYIPTSSTTVADLLNSITRDIVDDESVEFNYNGKELEVKSISDYSVSIDFTRSFLKFINQDSSNAMIYSMDGPGLIHTFTNVWNGDNLYLHSDLSSAPSEYVTDMPYLADKFIPRYKTSRSSDFTIWFTDDAQNNIVELIDETFIVELWLSKVDDSRKTP